MEVEGSPLVDCQSPLNLKQKQDSLLNFVLIFNMLLYWMLSLLNPPNQILVENLLLLKDNLRHLRYSPSFLPARYPSWFLWLVPVLSHSLYLRRLISNLYENPAREAFASDDFCLTFYLPVPGPWPLPPPALPRPPGTMTLAHGHCVLLPCSCHCRLHLPVCSEFWLF